MDSSVSNSCLISPTFWNRSALQTKRKFREAKIELSKVHDFSLADLSLAASEVLVTLLCCSAAVLGNNIYVFCLVALQLMTREVSIDSKHLNAWSITVPWEIEQHGWQFDQNLCRAEFQNGNYFKCRNVVSRMTLLTWFMGTHFWATQLQKKIRHGCLFGSKYHVPPLYSHYQKF